MKRIGILFFEKNIILGNIFNLIYFFLDFFLNNNIYISFLESIVVF